MPTTAAAPHGAPGLLRPPALQPGRAHRARRDPAAGRGPAPPAPAAPRGPFLRRSRAPSPSLPPAAAAARGPSPSPRRGSHRRRSPVTPRPPARPRCRSPSPGPAAAPSCRRRAARCPPQTGPPQPAPAAAFRCRRTAAPAGGRPRAASAPLSAATPAPRSCGAPQGQPPPVSGGDPCRQRGSAYPPVLGSARAPSPFPAGLIPWPCGCAPDLAPKPCPPQSPTPLHSLPATLRNTASGATTATLWAPDTPQASSATLTPRRVWDVVQKKQVLRPVLLPYIWDLSN